MACLPHHHTSTIRQRDEHRLLPGAWGGLLLVFAHRLVDLANRQPPDHLPLLPPSAGMSWGAVLQDDVAFEHQCPAFFQCEAEIVPVELRKIAARGEIHVHHHQHVCRRGNRQWPVGGKIMQDRADSTSRLRGSLARVGRGGGLFPLDAQHIQECFADRLAPSPLGRRDAREVLAHLFAQRRAQHRQQPFLRRQRHQHIEDRSQTASFVSLQSLEKASAPFVIGQQTGMEFLFVWRPCVHRHGLRQHALRVQQPFLRQHGFQVRHLAAHAHVARRIWPRQRAEQQKQARHSDERPVAGPRPAPEPQQQGEARPHGHERQQIARRRDAIIGDAPPHADAQQHEGRRQQPPPAMHEPCEQPSALPAQHRRLRQQPHDGAEESKRAHHPADATARQLPLQQDFHRIDVQNGAVQHQ